MVYTAIFLLPNSFGTDVFRHNSKCAFKSEISKQASVAVAGSGSSLL